MLLRDSLTRQDKLSYLIDWHRLTLVPYQNQIPARPGCGIGVGLPSLYSYSFSPRTLTGLKGINAGGNYVLARRQVPIVVSALGKAPHVLSIDGQDKAEIAPEVCDAINEQMT
jgi:hypothetical protein